LVINMAFQIIVRSVNMLIGEYDYELERILQGSSKIKKQFSKLLEREIKRMIEPSARTWVKVHNITCPHRINVQLSIGHIIGIPLSAVFAFA